MSNKIMFYKQAKAYDRAFSYRDYGKECNYIERCVEMYCSISRSHLYGIELASGPGRHAMELARRGIDMTALDNSEEMCRYGKYISQRECLNIEYIHGCMNEKIGEENYYGLAINMIDSISHILDPKTFYQHMKIVGRALKRDGIYIVEAALNDDDGADIGVVNEWKIVDASTDITVEWRDLVKLGDGLWQTRTSIQGRVDGDDVSLCEKIIRKSWRTAEIKDVIERSEVFKILRNDTSFSFEWSEQRWRNLFVLKKVED